MKQDQADALAHAIMADYAGRTGLAGTGEASRRYLWTDAFALCGWLGFFRRSNDIESCRLALRLIEKVHDHLGRHRADDPRAGWLCGLEESEGRRHPTRGGLRIGKELSERGPEEAIDERLEWERDGQYYHYLTKWMHALHNASRITGDPAFLRWAVELAATAHARFTYMPATGGRKKLYWKMSIDLSRPLVPAMGQHDPLDGFITFSELHLAANATAESLPDLRTAIGELAEMCRGTNWATEDPLGTGGLLFDAHRLAQLMLRANFQENGLLETTLDAALLGLEAFATRSPFRLPAAYRLPFRELGLAIGLKALDKLQATVKNNPQRFAQEASLHRRLRAFQRYRSLSANIEDFWVDADNQRGETWLDHREINQVMLATSLAPDGYLAI
ncbi:MAG: hypothetical protein WDA20_03230 [Desulfuromonadales bacterium]